MKKIFFYLVNIICLMGFLTSFINTSQAQSSCTNYSLAQDAIGLYFPGRGAFYLSDPDNSQYTQVVNFGPSNSNLIGLAGDWNHSGSDGLGYYDPSTSTFNLKYQASSGPADLSIPFNAGLTGKLTPVVGDWTGKGYKSIGVYDGQGNFYLKNSNTPGAADIVLAMGKIIQGIPVVSDGGIAIAGDWVGDGMTRVGIYDPAYSAFFLNMSNNPSNTSVVYFRFGGFSNGLSPLMGKWTSTMTTAGAGLYAGGTVQEEYSLGPNASNPNGYSSATVNVVPQGMPNGHLPQMIVGKWLPSQCLTAAQNTSPTSPSWMNGLVLYELRIDTFTGTAPGTFKTAAAQLPYLNSLGITGIIIDPVASLNSTLANTQLQNFYGPSLPDVLDPRLGTDTDFANFVSQAHALGIKVFADTVVHGIQNNSPYVPQPVAGITYSPPFSAGPLALPTDYFSHTTAGTIVQDHWGAGAQWDWTSSALRNWWTNNIGISWVEKYNIDGFRMDLEPAISGTILWNQIRSSILAATGKQIALIPELYTPGRGYTFDTTQRSVGIGPFNNGEDFYDGPLNFVNFVKSSPENYYTYLISDHDNPSYMAQGRLSVFAYGALLSPLIPHWYAGEEFNATPSFATGSGPLYFTQINWAQQQQPANLAFFNEVQQLITIRQTYKNIITPNVPLNKANILAVTSYSGTDLQPYTMWNGNSSITVVAKNTAPAGPVTLSIPVNAMGMGSFQFFNVTNLMNNAVSLTSSASLASGLTVNVPASGVFPLKLDAVPLNSAIIGNIDKVSPNGDGSYAVKGWACSTGVDIPVQVQLYIGSPLTLNTTGTSNLTSEPAVAAACGSMGNNFRFNLTLGANAVSTYGGAPLVVEGVSPVGGFNLAVSNGNGFTVPLLPPSVPVGVSATAGINQVILSWTAIPGPTTYTIGRSTVSGGAYTSIATSIVPATYTDSSVNNGTTYYYVVSAVNARGQSVNSSPVSAIPLAAPLPSAPLGVKATEQNTVIILWNSGSGDSSYNVKRALVSGGPYTTIANVTTNYYKDATANGNTTYYYVVSALSGTTESANSSEISITPLSAPAGVIATPGNGQVTLGWNAAPGATSYNIERITNGGSWSTIASSLTQTTYSDTSVSNNTPYWYIVVAANALGYTADSPSLYAEPEPPPPAPPTNIVATAGNAQVALTWNASVGAGPITYCLKRYSAGVWTWIATSLTSTSYTDTTVSNGITYTYFLRAINSGGESPQSTYVTATPLPAPVFYPMGSASSNDILAGWPVSNVIDGNPTTNYSSTFFSSAINNRGTYLSAMLQTAPQNVNEVILTARINPFGEVACFPLSYQIYVTAPNSATTWIYIGTYTTQSTNTNPVVIIPLGGTYSTYGFKIIPLTLGVDHYNNNYFQMAEVQLGES